MATKKKPNDLPIGYFITLIAKYYYSNDKDIDTLSGIVKEKLLEFNLEGYQEYKYHNKIVSVCNGLIEGTISDCFREDDFIPIYDSEIDFIKTLPNDKQKKLMFTLLSIARYMNCDGWINKKSSKDISEVFKLANVNLTSDKRNELLYELYSNGCIAFGKKVDNLNIKVKLNDYGKIAYKVKDFKNIGNQYIGTFKNGYKQCKRCGKIIKITGNKKMYCDKCATDNELLSKKKWWNNH